MSKFIVQKDTQSWTMQVWISFGLAAFMCFVAVWNVPGDGLERILLAVMFFFLLFTTFTLSKTIRDNQHEKVDTQSWILQVWIGFGISVSLSIWGIYRINLEQWHKWFVVGSVLFLLSSAFTLAKTIRDAHDATLLEIDSEKNA